eukprot:4178936-Ditylum_brightwellii.AAC.1
MDKKLQAHHDQNKAIAKKNEELMKEKFACIFAAMTNIQETTNRHNNQIGSLQDCTHKENANCKKHVADDKVLDRNMEELVALQGNRGALPPDKDGQGGA